VNIDFESVPSTQSANFTNFMVNLCTQMHTAIPGSQVSMCLGSVDWSNVYDEATLNQYVDMFLVMGYDYYWSGSSTAGPTDPLYNLETSSNYTLTRTITYYLSQGITPSKLILGLPYYGMQWATASNTVVSATTATGTSCLYNTAKANVSGNYSTKLWNETSFTPYYTYQISGQWYQCWIDDAYSLGKRFDLVNQRGIGGIGIWALGYDDGYTELWNKIRDKFSSCAIVNCSDTIYDMGGPQRNYYNSENYTYTIAPTGASTLSLAFTSFNTEANYDSLWIYNGANTASPLIGAYHGTNSQGTINSSGPALTLKFKSDNATVSSGWQAVWQCNVNSPPVTAGSISGPSNVCPGQNGVIFSIPVIANATGYVWSLPSGAIIAAGNNTNSITVNFSGSAAPGNITVYGNNAFGNGTVSPEHAVTVDILPSAPGTITGMSTVCQGQTEVIYSIPAITNATGYNWTLPTGAVITSGIDTRNITVSYGSSAVSGNITVCGTNSCGSGPVSSGFAVTVLLLPVSPGTITGAASVCQNQSNVLYTVPDIDHATAYVWTLPSGAILVSGYNSNSIKVSFGPNAVSGNITVYGTNNCGGSAVPANLAVTVNPAPVPAITGPAAVCAGMSGFTYTTEAGMTAYNWTITPGGVITAGAGTNAITVTWNSPGAQSVGVNYTNGNGCRASSATIKNVTVATLPVAEAGTTVTYTGTPVMIGNNGNGPGTISWAPPDGLSSSTVAQPYASPLATTVYTLTVNNNGCIATDTVSVRLGVILHKISGKTKYTGKANAGYPVPNQPYYNATIYNIDHVIVILKRYPSGLEVSRDTSDANGNFQLQGLVDGSYLLSYHKYADDTMQGGNGVDAIDVTLLKYNLGVDTLSDPSRCFSYKYKKAANVDNAMTLNAIDISRLKAKIGSPYLTGKNFPKGNWVALDTLVSIAGSDLIVTLKNICYGDYNASSTRYRDSVSNWAGVKSLPGHFIVTSDESIVIPANSYFEIPLRISKKMSDFSALQLELNYPDAEYELVSANIPGAGDKSTQLKINPSLDEIIADNTDLLVTDEDGVIRVLYATTQAFDVSAGDEIIRLGFRPRKQADAGYHDMFPEGTGLIANQYGEEDDDVFLVMPKIFIQDSPSRPDYGLGVTAYPNPFNDEVVLKYDLPGDGTVLINVYNLLGEKIAEAVHEDQAGGRHSVVFSQRHLPSGLYTFKIEYTISGKSKCEVLKMVDISND